MEDRWWIAQGENVQGPFTTPVMRRFIRTGKATEDRRYSRDGRTWTVGRALPELFAPPPTTDTSGGPPRTRVEAYGRVFDDAPHAGGRTFDPDSETAPRTVKIASWIVFLTSVIAIFAAAVMVARFPGAADAGLVLVGFALVYAVLGFYVMKGVNWVRITLIVLSVLAGLRSIRGLGGENGALGLFDLALHATVIGTLLSDSAVRFCSRPRARSSRRSRRVT